MTINAEPRQTGTILRVVSDRGFAFAQPSAGGDDVFVHVHSIRNAEWADIQPSTLIEYELGVDERTGRTRAVNVEVIG